MCHEWVCVCFVCFGALAGHCCKWDDVTCNQRRHVCVRVCVYLPTLPCTRWCKGNSSEWVSEWVHCVLPVVHFEYFPLTSAITTAQTQEPCLPLHIPVSADQCNSADLRFQCFPRSAITAICYHCSGIEALPPLQILVSAERYISIELSFSHFPHTSAQAQALCCPLQLPVTANLCIYVIQSCASHSFHTPLLIMLRHRHPAAPYACCSAPDCKKTYW
jgi:hypothetical protein